MKDKRSRDGEFMLDVMVEIKWIINKDLLWLWIKQLGLVTKKGIMCFYNSRGCYQSITQIWFGTYQSS